MFILSGSPSTTFFRPRVSSSSLSSSSSSSSSLSSSSRLCLVSVRSSARKSSACPCLFYSLKVSAMAELVKDTESPLSPIQNAQRRETNHSRTFLNTTTEEGESSLSFQLFGSWENATILDSYFWIEMFPFLIIEIGCQIYFYDRLKFRYKTWVVVVFPSIFFLFKA